MTADTPVCPACGAPTEADARRCSYCRAPVAPTRCSRCLRANPLGALNCSGCGTPLGLEPLAFDADCRCPRCRTPLTACAVGDDRLLDCEGCGGQFLGHALLRDLLEERADRAALAPRRAIAPGAAATDAVRYLPCPTCGALMNRRAIGAGSGAILDQCRTHGTWFDAGELPLLLELVASGLLRPRQVPGEPAPLPRTGALGALPTDAVTHASTPRAWDQGYLDDARAAAELLLDELRSLLRPSSWRR